MTVCCIQIGVPIFFGIETKNKPSNQGFIRVKISDKILIRDFVDASLISLKIKQIKAQDTSTRLSWMSFGVLDFKSFF
ncbi:MAG: hypothetical protein ACI83B_000879 [Sediminicola sp.]|jgi:hypothetical protein